MHQTIVYQSSILYLTIFYATINVISLISIQVCWFCDVASVYFELTNTSAVGKVRPAEHHTSQAGPSCGCLSGLHEEVGVKLVRNVSDFSSCKSQHLCLS